MRKSTGRYPKKWKEIAQDAKDKADWKCERCGHLHEKSTGYVLTVHHLDFNPRNNQTFNLAVLCQRCHLSVQSRFQLHQMWLFDESEAWMKPHIEGYYKSISENIIRSLTENV